MSKKLISDDLQRFFNQQDHTIVLQQKKEKWVPHEQSEGKTKHFIDCKSYVMHLLLPERPPIFRAT